MHEKWVVAERKTYMDWEVPERDHKRSFNYDVPEGKSFFSKVSIIGPISVATINNISQKTDAGFEC